jgi:segregation and condensation protein A
MDSNVFQVRTPDFEGPLELLLQLIEKRKLFINDVSLARVTNDYIEHVKVLENFPMRDTAQFVLVASTLLLLKSKSLLPTLTLTEEEEESIEDLERRLKLYKYFSSLSREIKEIFGTKIIFSKQYTKVTDPVFTPQDDFGITDAYDAIENVIARLPKKNTAPEVNVKRVVSLEETIQSLTERMQRNLKMSFREFAQHDEAEKVDVIIGFLAMLQLVKDEIINVSQDAHFEDIHMESSRPNIPQY